LDGAVVLGDTVGTANGAPVGGDVGLADGASVGSSVGTADGDAEGGCVAGAKVGDTLGAGVKHWQHRVLSQVGSV